MTSIRGYAALGPGALLHHFTYEGAPLGPYDVEVEITHCGICYSDIHLIDNDWNVSAYPFIPGHEIIGKVIETGNAIRLEKGQRVGIGWQRSACLQCDLCVAGQDNACPESQATCVGHNGGFAQRIRVDGRYAFPIPDLLASENAAPLLCAGVTVFSPLYRYAIRPTMRVGIIGIGGLGHLALQFARAFGCEVVALSHSQDKEGDAIRYGAHHFICSSRSDQMQQAAGTIDFLINTVDKEIEWPPFFALLRPHGKICFLGMPLQPIPLLVGDLLMGQKSLVTSTIGSRSAMREMLQFAARHGIVAQTECFPMSQVNTALKKVRENKVHYRAVLTADHHSS